MLTVLRVDASARNERSLSRKLADKYIDALCRACPDADIVTRDVGSRPPPFVTEAWIAAAFKAPEDRSPHEQAVLEVSDQLIAEVKSADLIVVASPLYNYGMPATLKAWVDQIVRVGKTFDFDLARGDFPIEPMLSGKKLVVLTSSGEFGFAPGGIRQNQDHLTSHLQTVAKYIGAESVDVIRIEYQEFGDERHETSKNAAFQMAEAQGRKLGQLQAAA
ncbi:NAD(P)H-dependent oxidoreductase [Labrenzia sp. OB1]|uniref:FMN-dependent NADH-azoreductase n=1 Tax=Labrenzia sp. OB1 TaxID=1561204 RepID=UPI0008388B1D|nr:NAD(P)H-dependent oxidoreductase [Labrenzia sp. OB1]